MTNWKSIHPDFTPELQKEWEEKGFSYEKCKRWIDTGLISPTADVDFAKWLRDDLHSSPEWFSYYHDNDDKLRNLKFKYFQKRIGVYEEKNYAKRIINDSTLSLWEKTQYITNNWVNELNDKGWLRFDPPLKNAEQWLSGWTESSIGKHEARKSPVDWTIERRIIKGSLNLKGFISLRKFECQNNRLTNLDLTDSPNLEKIICPFNDLNKLILFSSNRTSVFDLRYNKLTNLNDILNLNPETVTHLKLNNNEFDQNISDLSHLNKLKLLWIGNEDSPWADHYGGKNNFHDSVIDFPNLKELDYSNNKNKLTTLNLEKCKNLTKLDCSNNQLTNLQLPNQGTKLISLEFGSNKLKDPLFLSSLINLEKLDCSNNELAGELNLEQTTSLKKLICHDNQLTLLKLKKLLELKELFCHNNQLGLGLKDNIGIELPPDSEKLLLERVNISNNEKLNYEAVERSFMKPLPVIVENKIQEVGEAKLKQIIKEKVKIPGNIVDIQCFSTWWNPNCAVVINKIGWYYATRLVVYEPPVKWIDEKLQAEVTEKKFLSEKAKKEEIIGEEKYQEWISGLEKQGSMPEILKVVKISELFSLEMTRDKARELKEKLESDNPALAIYFHTGFSPDEVIERAFLPKEAKDEPDKYLKPMDIIWRKMVGMPNFMPDCYHVAVYLGNERVAHIGSSKFAKDIKFGRIGEKKDLSRARNDHWQDFLHDVDDKLIRYRLLVPFKRPEKIEEHIITATLAEYGAEKYNFLGNNCEHFATLCVYGIPFSIQIDKKFKSLSRKIYLSRKVFLDLDTEIEKYEEKFNEMISDSPEFKKELKKLKNYYKNEVKKIRKGKLSEEKQQELSESELEKRIKKIIKLETIQIFREIILLDNAPEEIKYSIIALWKEISKLNTDKSLLIGNSNAEGELINKEKIKQLVKDLQVIQINWSDDELDQAIINLQKEVDNYCEEIKKDAKEQIERLLQNSDIKVNSLPNLWNGSDDWKEHLQKLEGIRRINEFIEKMKKEIEAKEQGLKNQVEVIYQNKN
jgi:Leucine-rich repeat (LRR) protein